jgi:hypothetical protein
MARASEIVDDDALQRRDKVLVEPFMIEIGVRRRPYDCLVRRIFCIGER